MPKNKDLERKTRNYCAVLYPDCEEHQTAFETLLNDNDIKLCGITHDRDEYTEDSEKHKAGDKKKTHIHLVIEYVNPRTRNGIAKELGINKTALEPCDKLRGAKRYLLHLDDDDKVLYDISEVFGNNSDSVSKAMDKPNIDGNIEAPKLAEYIAQCDYYLTTSSFVKYCCSQRLFSLYRSASHSFHRMLDEHNKQFEKAGDCNE